jgi:hypothetical protein
MNDLDPQARAIVDAAREADAPSAADHDRIKRAVLVQIVAGTAVASTAAAGTLSMSAKVGLALVAVAVVGGGTAGIVKMRSIHQAAAVRARAAVRTEVAPRPAAAPLLIPQAPPVPTLPDENAKRTERPRKASAPIGRVAKAADEDPLNAEVAVLTRAREELRLGRPGRAIEALAEYDRLFGRGVLGEERQAIAAIAACQATPGPAARAQAEGFMRRAPASPLRERVREACITPTTAPRP